MSKKAQVTLFIIIAIVIVALVVLTLVYFKPFGIKTPSEIQKIEDYFQECVDNKVIEATKIAGVQSGYLELPDFVSGSGYMPFSNYLSFLGTSVPYWFYVSGNNIMTVQRPSLHYIENQFSDYLSSSVQNCDFSSFEDQGYVLEFSGEPKVEVSIGNSDIDTTVRWPLTVNLGETSSIINEHKVKTKTSFGSLYSTASDIFDYEQERLFLENYALDVLRLYAPVDGIELSCSPKVWVENKVEQDIEQALQGNIAAVKVKGSYYSLASSENKYFVNDIGKSVSEKVNFLYIADWNKRFEVWPSENGLLRADPIGQDASLGIFSSLGFCYVPYHFVYDLGFPVLIQIIKNDELFQFPVIILIENNQARESLGGNLTQPGFDLCELNSQQAVVFTYDQDSRPLAANLSFKCLNQVCDLGETRIEGSKISATVSVPQCYNGFLIASSPEFSQTKIQVTSTEGFVANLFLKPFYELEIEVPVLKSDEYASITFSSEDYTTSVYYPEQDTINLVEGIYDVTVHVFKESQITLPDQTIEKCIDVPAYGLLGMFGATREECYELDIPQETLTNVLFGGGMSEFSIIESELKSSRKMSFVVDTFDVPQNILELGDIYTLIDMSSVNIQLS